ncbi:RNA polymerase sigma-70 factor [soil metagenome]
MDDRDAKQFELQRPLMLAIAYRMLGSITEAEDIVQEAYLRYQTTAIEQIVSHKAFLSTIVTRLCLNQLQSARSQRQTYVGPWLPEPLPVDLEEQFTPTAQVELHESLSMAFLVLLEQLTPLERAIFLLREVFSYDYAEIAVILDKTEIACRQVFSRAKKHIQAHRPRFTPAPDTHQQMLHQFIQAVNSGELAGLVHLLADEVTLWADSGGKGRGAVIKPLYGCATVARFLLASRNFNPEALQAEVGTVNGESVLLLRADHVIRLVIFIGIEQEKVSLIRVIGNPDKLKWLNQRFDKRDVT